MLLYLIISFSLLLSPKQENNNELLEMSKYQASYYLTQLQKGKNVEASLWALTQLTADKTAIKQFVENKISDKVSDSQYIPLFRHIEDSYVKQLKKIVLQTESPNLLVSLLLKTNDSSKQKELLREFSFEVIDSKQRRIDYKTLCQYIVENKKITDEILPTNIFSLPHFFILFDKKVNNLFTRDYLNSINKNWQSRQYKPETLYPKLHQISYFRVLYLLYNYSDTSQLYYSLEEDKLFPNSNLKLRIYRYLDYSMYRLGFYDRSLQLVRTVTLPLSEYLSNETEKLNIKQLQGVYLYSIGKIHKAKTIYEEVIHEARQKNIKLPISLIYNNLAITYNQLGNYEKYLDLQLQALKNAEQNNNYSHRLEILNNLFVHFRENNNAREALNYLVQAKKIAQENGNEHDLGTIYTSLGSFYRKFENTPEKAKKYFAKAQKALDPKNNTRYFIKLLNEQGELYESLEKYEVALKKQNRIITLTENKKGPNYLDALINKALIYLKIGNINNASDLIKTFKSYNLNNLSFNRIIKAKTVEADYLFQTGRSEEALSMLNPAINQLVVRAKSSADLKSGFWHIEDEYLDAFDLAVSIYKSNGQAASAIKMLDQLKTINDARYYQNPLVKSSLLNESELTQYKRLTKQLDAIRKKLLTAPEDKRFNIRQRISQLKVKKRRLDKKLTNNTESDPISIRQVQNHLTAHEMILHITELKDQYYIANITRSDIDIHTVKLDSSKRKLLASTVEEVATHNTDLNKLYQITDLLQVPDIASSINKITVIPDSYFYQLPIDILPLNKPTSSYSFGQTTYLIEQFSTQYLTSLSDFSYKSQRPSTTLNPIGFAGYGISNFEGYKNKKLVPLPFAQKEVHTIAQKLTQLPKAATFTERRATKKTFRETASKARIIHMATHSEVSERDPMFSTLYMKKEDNTPDSTFNDQIFAYELFELNLNNEMIMLNSCESGSGSYIQGTGVMGISRALRYAGANSLVLNLWSVNDMLASDFAVYFYEQLNEGKSKAEALQAAKLYFLKSKNASPHFWGPYMLIGDSQPIVKPHYHKNLAIAGTFILYLLIMVGLSYLKEQGIIFPKNHEGKKEAA